ncbi:MAG TPA: hypothetical protein VF574_11550 [Allosphingosinicella sp.]|jgi:hypothetical protein
MTDLERRQPGKLRIRAVDECGKPIAGIRVELVTIARRESRSGKKPWAETVAQRALTTSRDGFAIFSTGALAPAARASGDLAVRFGESPELTYVVDSGAAAAGSHYSSFTLPDGPWLQVKAPGRWHDDGLEADDVWAIPELFPDLGHLEFGDDYCGRLIPSDLTIRIADHSRLVRTAKDVVTCLETSEGGCRNCGGLIQQGDGDGGIRLHEGELVDFQVRCARLGYSFGDLLYSLPLAPCESVTLAVSNWEQRQRARAEQESVSEEKRSADYSRRNALSETLDAASSSNHHQWGVTAGVLLKKITLGVSGGGAYDRVKFASKATRDFSDRIQQSSEAWRRDHQVVVMEQTETEDQHVSQRTVCNNNHCHVLNIFYHEVLNNYRVTTRMIGHREVYFVPYEVKEFNLHMALCAKSILRPYLIDGDLLECYDQLKITTQAATAKTTSVDEFKLDIKIGDTIGHNSVNLFVMIKTVNGQTQQFPVSVHEAWANGQSYSYIVNTPNFDLSAIHEVGLLKIIPSFPKNLWLHIESYTVSAKDSATGQWMPLGSGSAGPSSHDLQSMVPASYDPPKDELPPAIAADGDCAERLLAHLNCHKLYYNSLLWLLEDPNERFCRFDRIRCEPNGASLADLVIPEPVGVLGCHVAFVKADSDFIPDEGEPVVAEQLLALPTPGIFADAALGQCSACETIDPDVYWNWKDSPCPTCGPAAVQLKTPAESSLFPAGMLPFPTLPTAAWATGVAPPTDSISNSLVTTFGAALATAILPGKDSGKDTQKELAALQTLLTKMLEATKEAAKPGQGKPEDPKPKEAKPDKPK